VGLQNLYEISYISFADWTALLYSAILELKKHACSLLLFPTIRRQNTKQEPLAACLSLTICSEKGKLIGTLFPTAIKKRF